MIHGSIVDPGQDGPRRGRHHDRRDRRERSRLPRPRALALDPDRQGGQRHVRLLRRAGAGRARPGPRGQGPPRRARRGRRHADGDGRGAARSAGPASRRPRSTPRPWPASRPSSSSSRRAPTPTSSSTSGWPASAATTSTSTSTRSRRALAPPFLKIRVRDVSVPALTDGPLPSPDTIAGAFIRDLEARIARARGGRLDRRGGRAARRPPARPAAPRRPRGLAVRIRKLSGRDFRRYREFDIDFAPGVTVIRGPNEAGKTTIQRALELALTRRATSTAAEVEALRPWGAPPDARSVITVEFEQDDEDGQKVGTLEKTFAGAQGHGPPRLRRPVDHRPEPRRPGHGRADRHPDRGLLPVDRLGPPFRAERPVARRGRAARPPPGVDQRRRPRHEPGAQEARPGAPRPEHPRRPQPRHAQGRRAGRRAGEGGARAGRARPGPARARPRHDGRPPATAAPRPRRVLAERRSMLEKARQAERLAAERDAATERYERYKQAVEVHVRDPGPRQRAIRRPTRCGRAARRRRAAARPRQARSAS